MRRKNESPWSWRLYFHLILVHGTRSPSNTVNEFVRYLASHSRSHHSTFEVFTIVCTVETLLLSMFSFLGPPRRRGGDGLVQRVSLCGAVALHDGVESMSHSYGCGAGELVLKCFLNRRIRLCI